MLNEERGRHIERRTPVGHSAFSACAFLIYNETASPQNATKKGRGFQAKQAISGPPRKARTRAAAWVSPDRYGNKPTTLRPAEAVVQTLRLPPPQSNPLARRCAERIISRIREFGPIVPRGTHPQTVPKHPAAVGWGDRVVVPRGTSRTSYVVKVGK